MTPRSAVDRENEGENAGKNGRQKSATKAEFVLAGSDHCR